MSGLAPQGGADAVPPPAAWLDEGRGILERQSGASWAFADWLAAPGAPAGIADREIAHAVGVSREKIRHYREVSRAYPIATRIASLTFTHHRAAVRLPPEDRAELLAAAAREGWSAAATAEAAREAGLEAKVRRQAAEIRELRRQNAALRRDAKDIVAAAQGRLRGERAVAVDAVGRYAAILEELADPGLLERLHGNARRGLERSVEVEAESLLKRLNRQLARAEAALGAITGSAGEEAA